MPTILTFGDSNTFGTPPMRSADETSRLAVGERWPGVMANALGTDWTLIEEGLGGRTTVFDDPINGAAMNGSLGLRIALRSHGPIDWLVIKLGTNDCQAHYGADAPRIAAGMAELMLIANSAEMQNRHGGFRTLIICPPKLEEVGIFAPQFVGGAVKSAALSPLYRQLADIWNAEFIDAGDHISASPVDGIHYDAATHAVLGAVVAAKLS